MLEDNTLAVSSLSKDIPQGYTRQYEQAYAILDESPNASAALSRRCLQQLLEHRSNIKKDDLSKEIQQVLDSKQLPSHLAKAMDAIRNIGNFAAHPTKSTATGEIVQVEPGEAEWNLDVLEQLFDFYFVQPAETDRKKKALNAKLSKFGKPQMK